MFCFVFCCGLMDKRLSGCPTECVSSRLVPSQSRSQSLAEGDLLLHSYPQEDEGEETGLSADERFAMEVTSTFWSMTGKYMHRHHEVTRHTLYAPQEDTFPVSLQYIDVDRQTQNESGRVTGENQ